MDKTQEQKKAEIDKNLAILHQLEGTMQSYDTEGENIFCRYLTVTDSDIQNKCHLEKPER